ncbi:sugar nucleotide-binding protein [Patescibacteria group bacterium AH-259-L05]|nr:sugar nucleotide-binding protein [Patescibacteria group bacterium AH-259-L05]
MKRKKVLILGATGMLGGAIYDILKDKYELVLTVRELDKVKLLDQVYGGVRRHRIIKFDTENLYQEFIEKEAHPSKYLSDFIEKVGTISYIINAIGITIPYSLASPERTFFINSAFPHILANIFKEKLIHITTDCAYNGAKDYPYDENSPKTPVDLYGLSKSLGEPENCLTLRTSIIGRELKGFNNFLEWFLKQEGKTITGFANHFWNGITTKQFGKICDQIISSPQKYPKNGIYHVFSNTVSKYEMLLKFRGKYNIDCKIKKDTTQKLNRTLSTIYDFNSKLHIPSFDEMIKDL